MQVYKTIKYIRLSYTDDKSVESDSVANQRRLIDDYIARHPEIEVVAEKIDDGYSGVLFDRPAFQEMMRMIEQGEANCVIVKDLSRLGREYIETGRYMRRVFPAYGVRFIAINDNVDTETDAADDLTVSVKTHWGRGYIKYCQSLGIIAGKSATVFAPDAKVTTQEAAKMLLVTLGYDAKKAGLVGTGWASKTNALADENGLLDDVNTSFTAACPRQYAAQLIYNTIDAPTVVWRDDAYHHTNVLDKDNQTVGEKYMSLKKTTSTLTKVTKTNGKDTYTIKLDKTAIDWDNTTEDKDSDKALYEFTDVKKDYSDLLYKKVTVLHKDRKTVFGVYATDDNTQQSGLLKNLKMDSDKKVKLNGTKYDLADDTSVYVNGSEVTTTGETTIKDWVNKYGDGADTKYQGNYWQGTEVSLMADRRHLQTTPS